MARVSPVTLESLNLMEAACTTLSLATQSVEYRARPSHASRYSPNMTERPADRLGSAGWARWVQRLTGEEGGDRLTAVDRADSLEDISVSLNEPRPLTQPAKASTCNLMRQ